MTLQPETQDVPGTPATLTAAEQPASPLLHEIGPLEDGLVAGRPIENRSFELVELAAGVAAGVLLGSAVAGPLGTLVGGVCGTAAGFAAGEAVERRVGRAATTDAAEV